jgi:hypothetical protein
MHNGIAFGKLSVIYFPVQSIGKDSHQVIETKDKQITELKRMLEESTEVRNSQFEKKVGVQSVITGVQRS